MHPIYAWGNKMTPTSRLPSPTHSPRYPYRRRGVRLTFFTQEGKQAEGSRRDIHEPSPTTGWTGFMNVPSTAFGLLALLSEKSEAHPPPPVGVTGRMGWRGQARCRSHLVAPSIDWMHFSVSVWTD